MNEDRINDKLDQIMEHVVDTKVTVGQHTVILKSLSERMGENEREFDEHKKVVSPVVLSHRFRKKLWKLTVGVLGFLLTLTGLAAAIKKIGM